MASYIHSWFFRETSMYSVFSLATVDSRRTQPQPQGLRLVVAKVIEALSCTYSDWFTLRKFAFGQKEKLDPIWANTEPEFRGCNFERDNGITLLFFGPTPQWGRESSFGSKTKLHQPSGAAERSAVSRWCGSSHLHVSRPSIGSLARSFRKGCWAHPHRGAVEDVETIWGCLRNLAIQSWFVSDSFVQLGGLGMSPMKWPMPAVQEVCWEIDFNPSSKTYLFPLSLKSTEIMDVESRKVAFCFWHDCSAPYRPRFCRRLFPGWFSQKHGPWPPFISPTLHNII
jgi:hypothetical protein